MSKQTYQIDVPARGEFTVSGRRIPFDLEAGEHRAKDADEELVLRELEALGVARPATKRRAQTADAAAPAESDETGSVS